MRRGLVGLAGVEVFDFSIGQGGAAYPAKGYSVLTLPTDPVGTTSVTFFGVHAGSEIRVYLSDMTELAGVESSTDNPTLSWSVYAAGSPNNTVRIVIVHLDYKIREFTYTSSLGNQTIPVQQEPDKWRSNPE